MTEKLLMPKWQMTTLTSLAGLGILLLITTITLAILRDQKPRLKENSRFNRFCTTIFWLFPISLLAYFLTWSTFFVDQELGWRHAVLAITAGLICVLSLMGMLGTHKDHKWLFWILVAITLIAFAIFNGNILDSFGALK